MNLTTEDVALLRSLVEWRRANGWTKSIVWRDSGRDADGAPWDDGYKIHVWSNSVSCIEVYLRPWMVEDGGPNLEQVLYQDIESDDTCVVWGARLVARLGLVRLVDSLSALGALPVEFSSAGAAGRESAYTTDEWRVVAGPEEFPTVFQDEIGTEEHLEIVLRDARNRWRGEVIWVQHRRTGATDWEKVADV